MKDIVERLEQGRVPASCDRPSEILLRCERGDCECEREDAREAAQMIRHLRGVLHEIAEEWAGSECGEPVTAQEGYAIMLLKRIYALAIRGNE